MQISQSAWPGAYDPMTHDSRLLRIAKKIVMVCGIFVEGRRQILLYSCK